MKYSNPYRMGEINRVINNEKTPFNTPVENMTLEAVRRIASYCELTDCTECKIKNLIFCNGKLNNMPSPSGWLEGITIREIK